MQAVTSCPHGAPRTHTAPRDRACPPSTPALSRVGTPTALTAVKLGDRIAVLGPGSSVLQFDTPEAILTNPAEDTDPPARGGRGTAGGDDGEVLAAHPEIEDVLASLVDILTNDVMVEMTMRVDVDGEDRGWSRWTDRTGVLARPVCACDVL